MRTAVYLLPLVALVSFAACEDAAATKKSTPSTDDEGTEADSGKKTTKKDAGKSTSTADAEATVDCPSFAAPVSRGTLNRTYVDEASGLAASRVHPGVLWTHNDSANPNKLYAISATDGRMLAEYTVSGASNIDWEDIALDSETNEIYLADIGDNAAFDGKTGRAGIVLYRMAEPKIEEADVVDGAPMITGTVTATKIEMTYPDGAHNAESFAVDSAKHEGYVFSKMKDGTSTPYKIDLGATSPVTLTKLTTRTFKSNTEGGVATGADIGESGILLRTYTGVFLFPRLSGDTVADMWARTPCILDAPKATQEVQGEAIAWAADEKGYFTTTESPSEFISQPLDYSAKK